MTFAHELKDELNAVIEDISSDPKLYAENPDRDFSRSRVFDMKTIIQVLLTIGGNSLNKELYEFFKGTNQFATVSAFVQQRKKLKPEALEEIFHEFNEICNDEKLFHGYRLLAVDGSVMAYNGTPAQDTYLPKSGHGVNQYHVNAVYDIMNKTYADVIIQPQPQTNEPKAAWQMMERMADGEKVILMGDRGYASINLMEHINRIQNAEYLLRIKNNQWKNIRDLPKEDFDIDIKINLRTTQTNKDKEAYAKGEAKWVPGHGKYRRLKRPVWDFESPYSVTVRIVRFKISDDEYETIATSLPRATFPPGLIKQVYHLRWGIETSFRELKYAIGVTNFHAKKCKSIVQEIWARLIMYNFAERITMHTVIYKDNGHKWTYQANYTMGIHICLDFFRTHNEDPPDPEIEIARYILPIRPNRADRRKVEQKPAVFFIYRVS